MFGDISSAGHKTFSRRQLFCPTRAPAGKIHGREALMIQLSEVQRQAVERGEPVLASVAGKEFVLLRSDVYRPVQAAWQLEQMGREAWPVLQELFLAEAPECEYFLAAVVRLQDVASSHRLTALLAAARNPDANVRSRLLELLEEIPGELRGEVLR